MKIKLSKSQWEQAGRTAGWMEKVANVSIEQQFLHNHDGFSFYYRGENNEGASGKMSMNINECVWWLKSHLSSSAFELFLNKNMDSTDSDLQKNVEPIFNVFIS